MRRLNINERVHDIEARPGLGLLKGSDDANSGRYRQLRSSQRQSFMPPCGIGQTIEHAQHSSRLPGDQLFVEACESPRLLFF